MITRYTDLDLKPYNTFGISAKCAEWIDYTEANEIPKVIAQCANKEILSIGNGSNMLFTKDFDGTILHSSISGINSVGNTITIGAGVQFDNVIEYCCHTGLWGIENLSGIPGNAGAAAVQNIGAYGIEIKDVIKTIRCYDTQADRFVDLAQKECQYGYRSSVFKNSGRRYIVASITIELTDKRSPNLGYAGLSHLSALNDLTPQRVRDEILCIRNAKLPDPSLVGNAGSFFKNPILSEAEYQRLLIRVMNIGYNEIPHYKIGKGFKIPAAWLIEQCGFKGQKYGNAGVWHKQPLVLINATGHATGSDILDLEKRIINTVTEKFGITLQPEVEHI